MKERMFIFTDPVVFRVTTTILCLVLGGLVLWSIFSIYKVQTKPAELSAKNRGAFEDDSDDDDEFEADDTAQHIFDTSADNAILYGKTDHYDWQQNETEVEMFVNLKSFGDRNMLKAKDIEVTLKNTSLKIKVKGVVLVDGDFFAKVLADECNWQLDKNSDGEQIIWLNLYKTVPTVRNQHWKCILKGDEQIKVAHLGPPVHGVDPSDPNAVKKAIQQVTTVQ